MKNKKKTILVDEPILPGCVSAVKSKCGKKKCVCKAMPPQLHGPYYRWTGSINGKPTTRNISEKVAQECQRRIENYRKLQQKVNEMIKAGLENAPWLDI